MIFKTAPMLIGFEKKFIDAAVHEYKHIWIFSYIT